MRSGELNKYGVIQRSVETRDAAGGVTQSWTTHAVGYFQVQPLSGREYIAAQQVSAEVTHKVMGRWVRDVTAKMRLLVDSRVFEFLAVMNWGERNREMRIMAKEIV